MLRNFSSWYLFSVGRVEKKKALRVLGSWNTILYLRPFFDRHVITEVTFWQTYRQFFHRFRWSFENFHMGLETLDTPFIFWSSGVVGMFMVLRPVRDFRKIKEYKPKPAGKWFWSQLPIFFNRDGLIKPAQKSRVLKMMWIRLEFSDGNVQVMIGRLAFIFLAISQRWCLGAGMGLWLGWTSVEFEWYELLLDKYAIIIE